MESEKGLLASRFYAFILLFLTGLCIWMIYLQSYDNIRNPNYFALEVSKYANYTILPTLTDTIANKNNNNSGMPVDHLVYSEKCKIPNINPWNNDVKGLYYPKPYVSCSPKPLLTSVSVKDNKLYLQIHKDRISYYSKSGVKCCYSVLTRGNNITAPDDTINISYCKNFEEKVAVDADIVYVKCKRKRWRREEVYKNVHTNYIKRKEQERKLRRNDKHLSVLFIGIDSVSRSHLIRAMPFTLSFLEGDGWIPLKGYNKVADNTFPNLMAILTGMNQSEAYHKCNPKELGHLDKCRMLWYDFRQRGYVTSYAEDQTNIGTFNYNKKGFTKPPTDYYFRPYMMGAEKYLPVTHVDDMWYCTGVETSGERILNLAESFVKTFKDYLYFGFFWMNTFSHNKLESISRMDVNVSRFLQRISDDNLLNHTITIFLSDHGIRFGDIRYTRTGWLEERLPFIYVKFPSWFPSTFPLLYQNFMINQNRLTTPYDLHMTLQDILFLTDPGYPLTDSSACPQCKSLFAEAPEQRSCQEAAISPHWCTCTGFQPISSNETIVRNATTFILRKINELVASFKDEHHLCATFELHKVMYSSISENSATNSSPTNTYLLITLETQPMAVFESTVHINMTENGIIFGEPEPGSISRLNSYKSSSHCVKDAYLKMYCYCY